MIFIVISQMDLLTLDDCETRLKTLNDKWSFAYKLKEHVHNERSSTVKRVPYKLVMNVLCDNYDDVCRYANLLYKLANDKTYYPIVITNSKMVTIELLSIELGGLTNTDFDFCIDSL